MPGTHKALQPEKFIKLNMSICTNMISFIVIFYFGYNSLLPAGMGKTTAEKIESHIQQYVKNEDFRGTILVAKNGNVIHKAAYGYADETRKVVNETETQYLIGSLTKSFTAVTVMQMVEDDLLDLHTPIRTYVPRLKKALGKDLTLHLLLKHQSGLPGHLERLIEFENRDISSDEILEIINTSRLAFSPGSRYQYSNLNYHLVAIVIERVSGRSYPQVLQERTFGPLNMRDSGVERLANVPQQRAKGYRKNRREIVQEENIVSYALGSGDIYSTVDDLLKWDQALYGTELLSESSKKTLFSGENETFGNYGYGFRIQQYQRNPEISSRGVLARHGGSMNGFLSNLHRYLDDKLTIIVLSNFRPFPIRNLTFELKEISVGVAVGERNRKKFE